MTDEKKDIRINLLLSESDVARIDDWGFANHIRSRNEVIRRLIEKGLKSDKAQKK